MPAENRFWENFKRRIPEFILASFLIGFLGFVLYNFISYYIVFSPKERQLIEKCDQLLNSPEFYKKNDYTTILKVQEYCDNLKSKSYLWRGLPVLDFKVWLSAFISFSIPAFLISLGFSRYLKNKESFFFRIPQKENPLKLGEPKKLWFFKDDPKKPILSLTKKEFIDLVFNGDVKRYVDVISFFDGEIVQEDEIRFPKIEINKEIERLTNKLVKYGKISGKIYTKEDEKLFRACLYLSLMHYVASLYGNIPVSFLSPIIQNPVVRFFNSTYYYKKLVAKEGKVRNFLAILHTYPEDILEHLKKKFTPLSFEKYDAFYFQEQYFSNVLAEFETLEEKEQKQKSKGN